MFGPFLFFRGPFMARLLLALVLVSGAFLALGGYRVFQASSIERDAALAEVQQRDLFAADREPAAEPVKFDGDQAMTYLEQICKIGPRISGSDGMKKQQELVKKHFEARGAKVRFQEFSAKQESQAKPVAMANLIASWNPERKQRVILCSHYDTRPIADQEEDPRKWRQPFVSANDGGSGVAFLMEMANHMKELKTSVGLDYVLFDGEEFIFEKEDKYFFGSEHFARAYTRERPPYRYVAAVLMDMIAGKNVHIPAEQNSWFQARSLVEELWNTADELGCKVFDNRVGPSVLDDHLALNKSGIPAVDLIDFEYKHWHRLSDIPANCAPDGMSEVAKVLSVWLQRMK
jgi:hypothetical protein